MIKKLSLQKFSRFGLFASALYVLPALYLLAHGLMCDLGLLGCDRLLFILIIPSYVVATLFVPLIGTIGYLVLFALTSAIYSVLFYKLGAWIELAQVYFIKRNNHFTFKKIEGNLKTA